jgi:hypothetical protein
MTRENEMANEIKITNKHRAMFAEMLGSDERGSEAWMDSLDALVIPSFRNCSKCKKRWSMR